MATLISQTITDEQQHAVDMAQAGNSLKIAAFAGTGKTTTLRTIANAKQGKRGLYLSFNKSIADEAAQSFPGHVQCKTAHSLAYAGVGHLYRNRLNQRLAGIQVADALNIKEGILSYTRSATGYLIMETLQQYTRSNDSSISTVHVPKETLHKLDNDQQRSTASNHAIEYARRLWAIKTDVKGLLPITHDDYLKLWALQHPQLNYDFILFDEAQDANPVMLALVTQQASQQIFVGDRFQQIYAWRGAVNAMDSIETDKTATLRQSFRFGSAIAETANRILGLNNTNGLIGSSKISSQIIQDDAPQAIICRSNAGVIETLITQMAAQRKTSLLGGSGEIVGQLRGAQQLRQGRPSTSPELSMFSDWSEVKQYAESDAGASLKSLVKLVDKYSSSLSQLIRVIEMAGKITANEAEVTITTTHKAKGREWDSVQVHDDFFTARCPEQAQAERNLLYVAATRAKTRLDVTQCHPLRNKVSVSEPGFH